MQPERTTCRYILHAEKNTSNSMHIFMVKMKKNDDNLMCINSTEVNVCDVCIQLPRGRHNRLQHNQVS